MRREYRLDWIDEATLESHLEKLLERSARALKEAPGRSSLNVIDPFGALLQAALLGMEKVDDLQKIINLKSGLAGMSNHLGSFHQDVLGSISGWVNHDRGYDLESGREKIIAEVKNKNNSMNASNRRKVIEDLTTALRQKPKGWRAYLVIILPRKRLQNPRKISDGELYEIDGAAFYALASGSPSALKDLYQTISWKIGRQTNLSAELENFCAAHFDQAYPQI